MHAMFKLLLVSIVLCAVSQHFRKIDLLPTPLPPPPTATPQPPPPPSTAPYASVLIPTTTPSIPRSATNRALRFTCPVPSHLYDKCGDNVDAKDTTSKAPTPKDLRQDTNGRGSSSHHQDARKYLRKAFHIAKAIASDVMPCKKQLKVGYNKYFIDERVLCLDNYVPPAGRKCFAVSVGLKSILAMSFDFGMVKHMDCDVLSIEISF